MRHIRIFQAGSYQPGHVITLSDSAAQHVGPVLRLALGDRITLFCGDNREYQATLCDIQKKSIRVRIESMTVVNRESPRPIHLAQAIAKGDKMEWIIQKAVELGVTSITPLLTERCVVRLDASRLEKKQQQWHAIAIAACEQSGRNRIPTIYPSCTLDYYLSHCDVPIKLILSPHTADTWPLIQEPSTAIALIVGPEGGLSAAEVEETSHYQACAVRLGPRILRSETAAITALGIIQTRYGDF